MAEDGSIRKIVISDMLDELEDAIREDNSERVMEIRVQIIKYA